MNHKWWEAAGLDGAYTALGDRGEVRWRRHQGAANPDPSDSIVGSHKHVRRGGKDQNGRNDDARDLLPIYREIAPVSILPLPHTGALARLGGANIRGEMP